MLNVLSLQTLSTTAATELAGRSTLSVRCGGDTWSTFSWGCQSKVIAY